MNPHYDWSGPIEVVVFVYVFVLLTLALGALVLLAAWLIGYFTDFAYLTSEERSRVARGILRGIQWAPFVIAAWPLIALHYAGRGAARFVADVRREEDGDD